MNTHTQHYQTIHEFFDAWSLAQARRLLKQVIKTADAEKTWKGPCPANAIYFTERVQLLAEAAFNIVEQYDHRPQVILNDEDNSELWKLTCYHTYCGRHYASTPWDFFPRHLSVAEFKDPYRALRKFIRYRSLNQWNETLKELCHHALSPDSIQEFDDGTGILGTWLLLHKLLKACHLIEVRMHVNGKQSISSNEQTQLPAEHSNKKDEQHEQQPVDAKEDKQDENPTLQEVSWECINDFFVFFGEEGAAEELWAMLKRSLCNEHDETSAKDRSNMIFLYEQLVDLVDDIYVLNQRHQSIQNTSA